MQIGTVAEQCPNTPSDVIIDPEIADTVLAIPTGPDHEHHVHHHHHPDFKGRTTEGIQFKHFHSVRVLGMALYPISWMSLVQKWALQACLRAC